MRAIFLLLLLSSSSFAASVSSSYTCVQGHEQEAIAKLQAFGIQALKDFFKNRNIDINESTLKFNVTLTTQADTNGGTLCCVHRKCRRRRREAQQIPNSHRSKRRASVARIGCEKT